MPTGEIRDYYGESVAFYFGWMSFYTASLIPVALAGLLMTVMRSSDVTIDKAPYVPFFALGMVIWGFVFVKLWKRKTAEFAYQFDTLERVTKINYRADYHGKWHPSEITGEMELYYPTWKRRCKYLVSGAVTLAM